MTEATKDGGSGGGSREGAADILPTRVTSPCGAKRSPDEIDLTGFDTSSDSDSDNSVHVVKTAASAEQHDRSSRVNGDGNTNAITSANANTNANANDAAANRNKVLLDPDISKPKKGKLIRSIILPRTDPNDPKSTFGLNVKKSEAGLTVATYDYPKPDLAKRLGLKAGHVTVRKNDIIVAVNGTVVFDVASETAVFVFRDVVHKLKETPDGQPLTLDVLRYGDDENKAVASITADAGARRACTNKASSTTVMKKSASPARPTASQRQPSPPKPKYPKPYSPEPKPPPKMQSPIQTQRANKKHQQEQKEQKQKEQHSPTPLFIVEIPKSASVGDLLKVQIPPSTSRPGQVLGVVCPDNIASTASTRYIRIVLPGDEAPPISGATKLMHATSSPVKDSPRQALRISSPSMGRKRRLVSSDEEYGSGADTKWNIQWEDYEKSSSRVGRAYQVSAFPKAMASGADCTSAAVTQKAVRQRGALREMEDWSNEPPLG